MDMALGDLGGGDDGRPAARLELVGAPALYVGATTVAIPDKAYFVAATLALTPGRRMIRSKLRDLLWGSAGPAQANANLRQLLSRITRLQRSSGFVLIVVDAEWIRLADATAIDLVDWLDADVAGLTRRREWPALSALLCRYDRDLLEGVRTGETSLDDWLAAERERFRFAWISAAVALLEAGAAPPEVSLAIASRLVARDNTHEAAYRAMMRAHAAVGDIAAARRAYAACRQALLAELGEPPQPETVSTAERILGLGTTPVPAEPVAPAPQSPAATRDRPRVAILPPTTAFERWAQSRAYALLEDITVGLSRYRSFRIIAAHTSLLHGARPRGREREKPWCDFALFASGRIDGSALHLGLRLTEVATDEVIWAHEVALPRDDLRGVHREITARIVSWTADAIDRAQLAPPATPKDPSAYRLFLEGRRFLQSTDLRDLRRARKVFRDSTRLDDSFAATYAGLARTHSLEWLVRGAPTPDLLEEATALAAAAVERDPDDARGHREAGFAKLYRKHHDDSLECFRRAVDLNPHDADLLADYADALAHAGDPAAGLDAIGRALRLNPVPPDYYHWVRGSIFYQVAQFEDALAALAPVARNPATARLLAASAARAGDREAAELYARAVRETFPDFRTEQLWNIVPNRNSDDTRNLIDGLRAAGLP